MTPEMTALITASESKTTRILEKAEGVSAREIVGMMERIDRLSRLIPKMHDALVDAAGGLEYVRFHYGELYGVGFQRAKDKFDLVREEYETVLREIIAPKQSGNKGKDNG